MIFSPVLSRCAAASLGRPALGGLLALTIGLALAACQTPRAPRPAPDALAAPPPEETFVPPPRSDQPGYFRLRGMQGRTPVRVALLLPFSHPSAETRALADALEKSAEMALFEAGNADILLMPRDDGGSPERAAAAARQAIGEGAEIIVGPLFAQAVTAVQPIARAEGVPVLAFSTERAVGGDGVFLLSFQPETEVDRIVSYAADSGRTSFAALVPQTAYGDKIAESFRAAVAETGGTVAGVESYPPRPEAVGDSVRRAAQSGPDAVLIGDGGVMLQTIAPMLAQSGASNRRVKFLGTGLWDDPRTQREPMLSSGWFAAPAPEGWSDFAARYRAAYNATPPRIASLGYDALSLIALLSRGEPYERFTDATLTDPNGFRGIDGIFRFHEDGSADRGLAVLEVGPNGFTVLDPAPRSFRQPGS